LEKIKIATTPEMVEKVYSKLEKNISTYRKNSKPFTNFSGKNPCRPPGGRLSCKKAG
tara:strand:+ start:90 stop:260 length:171 start_codon:yes stop_codon:yes gene_type:complete